LLAAGGDGAGALVGAANVFFGAADPGALLGAAVGVLLDVEVAGGLLFWELD